MFMSSGDGKTTKTSGRGSEKVYSNASGDREGSRMRERDTRYTISE